MLMFITVVAAFLVSLILGRFLIPVLRALKAGQSIREIGPQWHNTKAGTPTMGGLMFIAASLLSLVFGISAIAGGELRLPLMYLLALAFGAIGFYDDFIKVKKKRNLGLTAIQKLTLQILASAAYIAALKGLGYLTNDIYIPFVQITLAIPFWLYIIFAAFVIVGCVNAVNLTDGIDGLAGGVTIPVMLYFAIIAMIWKQNAIALFPLAMVGGLLGFLCYNFHPAKVFMGDTGSLFLGGAVCGLAFALDMPLVLVLVGLVYVVEAMSDILQVGYFKLTHGKRIFKMAPIHHHFEMCGWSEIKIFVVFVSVTVLMCALALLGTMGRY